VRPIPESDLRNSRTRSRQAEGRQTSRQARDSLETSRRPANRAGRKTRTVRGKSSSARQKAGRSSAKKRPRLGPAAQVGCCLGRPLFWARRAPNIVEYWRRPQSPPPAAGGLAGGKAGATTSDANQARRPARQASVNIEPPNLRRQGRPGAILGRTMKYDKGALCGPPPERPLMSSRAPAGKLNLVWAARIELRAGARLCYSRALAGN
jgi:hypothetical protein